MLSSGNVTSGISTNSLVSLKLKMPSPNSDKLVTSSTPRVFPKPTIWVISRAINKLRIDPIFSWKIGLFLNVQHELPHATAVCEKPTMFLKNLKNWECEESKNKSIMIKPKIIYKVVLQTISRFENCNQKSILDENKVIILFDIEKDVMYENIIFEICLEFMP